jgi:DNA-directed RNA polymerase specialized sigma24 family protein
MEQKQIEQLFIKHQKQINKAAWELTQKYQLEFEEVQAQGNLIFVESCYKWNPHKASFSTYLTDRLHKKLYTFFVVKQQQTDSIDTDISYTEQQDISFSEQQQKLHPDAKIVLDHIMNSSLMFEFPYKKNLCNKFKDQWAVCYTKKLLNHIETTMLIN